MFPLGLFNDQERHVQVTYISSYITLLANLCAGRNEKGIRLVEEAFQLTPSFMMKVLECDTSIVIKSSFRSLLMNTYLNLDPMKRLSEFNNKNIIYDYICEFDPDTPTYKLIGVEFYNQLKQHQKGILANYAAHRRVFISSWTQSFSDISLSQVRVISDTYNHEVYTLVIKKLQAFIGFL